MPLKCPAKLARSLNSGIGFHPTPRSPCRSSLALPPRTQPACRAPARTIFVAMSTATTRAHAAQRRSLASSNSPKPNGPTVVTAMNGNGMVHEHNRGAHRHSHSVFGHHDHAHDHAHGPDAEKVIEALKGKGDRGSRITLIGLFANIGLTAAKGSAAWMLHSASLMADAAHSLSDLLGDFVTLFCWQLSRRPKSDRFPYGFGKFEILGTSTVSLLLIGGAWGIGFHSYYLLTEALYPTIQALPPGAVHDILESAAAASEAVTSIGHGHAHAHALDPNAAWFAAVSVVAKEWLYRATKKVADEERSSVLHANAVHHRSDAWSSLVALVAIIGNWLVPGLPLDPIGGLLVSFVILKQGLGLFRSAFNQLMDAGVSDETRRSLIRQLEPLLDASSSDTRLPHLLSVRDLRAVRSGAMMFVDLTAVLPADTSIRDANVVQENIKRRLIGFRKEISEVRVKLVPSESRECDVDQ